jgi:hypothetical protein
MKIVFISFLVAMPLVSLSQQGIIKDCDDMTDKCIYYPKQKMAVANEEKTIGFTMTTLISSENDQLTITDIMVQSVNIGTCNENDKLIIMLDDSTKISWVSWNKFNCDGDAWFSLKQSDIERLESHKIIKAYFQNGKSYESFTNTVQSEDQNYFVNIITDCRNKKFSLK